MPCYQVNTMSVNFTAKHFDLLMKAAEALGWKVVDWRNREGANQSWRKYVEVSYTGQLSASGSFLLDLENGVAKFNEQSKGQEKLNELKRKYAEVTIEEIAKRKRWSMKKRSANTIELARY